MIFNASIAATADENVQARVFDSSRRQWWGGGSIWGTDSGAVLTSLPAIGTTRRGGPVQVPYVGVIVEYLLNGEVIGEDIVWSSTVQGPAPIVPSAKSKTDLCQIALGKIGVSKRLNDVTTDQANEAIQCRLYFDGALDRALGELPWKFATRTAALTDIGTPPDRWGYRYALPADCVTVRSVPAPALFGLDPGPLVIMSQVPLTQGAPFEIVEDEPAEGLALCTDVPDASLIYTARIATTALYPQTFIDLFGWSLAMDLAAPLATSAGLINSASQGYAATVLRVGARDLNQETPRQNTVESDFINARY